jgi:hypothetical protein
LLDSLCWTNLVKKSPRYWWIINRVILRAIWSVFPRKQNPLS